MKLPRWKCHKEVDGFQIDRIVGNSLISADAAVYVTVDEAYMKKHEPKVGGYYVKYLDGYESFSPAQPFESGYSKVRKVLHIKLPEELSPSMQDMQAVMDMFLSASHDPEGGVVVTGHGIHATVEEVLIGDECDTIVISMDTMKFDEVLEALYASKDEKVVQFPTPKEFTVCVRPAGFDEGPQGLADDRAFVNNTENGVAIVYDLNIKNVVLSGVTKEELHPELAAVLFANDNVNVSEVNPNWYTVEVFPAGKTIMVESYKNHIFVNNERSALRLIRGRSVKRVILHGMAKEDLLPDVRNALENTTATRRANVGPVDFEEQP